MTISVITSFNEKYYTQIGQYSVASFLSKWPADINIVCYVEECELVGTNRIIQIPFSELGQSYIDFQNADYKNRVKVFAKKAYSIIHAMENLDSDFIIWIDSDVLTHSTVTESILSDLCNATNLTTFMGVKHPKDKTNPESEMLFSCESSFFVLNKRHPKFNAFAKRYREYYDNRLVENLRRFYDGDVLGAVIMDLADTANMRDLSPSHKHKTPMPRTILNDYVMHFKAGLKDKESLKDDIYSVIGDVDIIPLYCQ